MSDLVHEYGSTELLATTIIDDLASAAARHGVMISITVTPYDEAEGNSDGESA